jgi:signal transduction histidine kinase
MGLFAVVLALRPLDPRLVLTVDVATQVLAPAIAAILCVLGVRLAPRGGPYRRVILACAIGFTSIFLANVCFAISFVPSVIVAGHASFDMPDIVAPLDILGYLGLLIAAFTIVGYPQSWYLRGQLYLDSLLLLAAAAACSWYYLLGPAIHQAPNGFTNVIIAGMLPLCDLVLLWPVVMMWLAPSTRGIAPIIRLFWIACATNILGDSVNSWLTLQNPYSFGSLADVASPAATLLAGYGAWSLRHARLDRASTSHQQSAASTWRRLLLPYAAIPLLAFLLLQVRQSRTAPELAAGVIVAIIVFVALVLARQTLVLLDIRKTEMTLRRSEARLRAVMSHAPITFFVMDPDGRFTLVAGREHVRPDQLPSPIVGRSAFEMYHLTPDAEDIVHQALAGKPGQILIDQGKAVIDCRLEPMSDAAGRVAEVVGVAMDITEAAHARRAAEDLAHVRSDFVASVSHELRTPLTAILGYAELLQGHWTRMDDVRRLRTIDLIVLSANRQRRLVDDLLLLSQTDSHDLTTTCIPLILGPLVEHAAEETRATYKNQRVALAGSLDLCVLADPDRTLQILANLMDNAAKYSREGSPIEVAWQTANDMAEVRIRDFGPGVPEEGQTRLFTRFGRVPGSRIRAGRVGTGLGLYIGRTLADAMGGALTLEATGPGGSTFLLSLPLAIGATSGIQLPDPRYEAALIDLQRA